MRFGKCVLLLLCFGLAGILLRTPDLRASVWNKKTHVTFNEPVEIPGGVVLQPGDYVMKLMDSPSNRNIVQVFNERENQVYATILAIPKYRMEPADKTVITFYETPAGEPRFIRAWFYPGDTLGQEFAYPKDRATYLATNTGLNVPVAPSEAEQPASTAVTPQGEEIALNTGPEDSETSGAEPATTPAFAQDEQQIAQAQPPAGMDEQDPAMQGETPQQLPETASSLPLIGLIGLVSVASGLALRWWRVRLS